MIFICLLCGVLLSASCSFSKCFLIILSIVHLGKVSSSERELGEVSEERVGLQVLKISQFPHTLPCSGVTRRSPRGSVKSRMSLIWYEVGDVRTYTCTSVCFSTRAHTGVLRSFFLLQWARSAPAGLLATVFYSLCCHSHGRQLFNIFPLSVPPSWGHFFAPQRHLGGSRCPSPMGILLF